MCLSLTRLLSTTSLLQTYTDETIIIHPGGLMLSGTKSDPKRASVTVRIDPSNNLPVSQMFCPQEAEVVVDTLTNVCKKTPLI